ncbi:MAG: AAA family ATPase, partial [Spirulinaceae cyanobacterium]
IEIREMELVFVCNEGKDEFILESASGGISSLIELSWQIYTFSLQERGEFTVLIDEIENHLHPTMQRRVLYDLVNAFPQARFIVTTHSPLVVSSVKDSSVYALRYNDRNKIESHKLDLLNKAKTAQEILDEVLGVSFTMPIWVEEKLTQIVQQYAADNMDEAKFSQMRADLQEMGLERLMPTAIQSVVEQEPS